MKILIILFLTALFCHSEEESNKKEISIEDNKTVSLIYSGSLGAAGISFMSHRSEKIGFYADFIYKSSGKDDQVVSTVSRDTAENFFKDTKMGIDKSYSGFNLGLTKELNDYFTAIAGIGILAEQLYYNYYDKTKILKPSGNYSVKESGETKTGYIIGVALYPSKRNIKTLSISILSSSLYETTLAIGVNF